MHVQRIEEGLLTVRRPNYWRSFWQGRTTRKSSLQPFVAAITWRHPQEWEELQSNDVKFRTRTEDNAICRFPSQTKREISTSEQGCSFIFTHKGKTQKRARNGQGFETKAFRQDRSFIVQKKGTPERRRQKTRESSETPPKNFPQVFEQGFFLRFFENGRGKMSKKCRRKHKKTARESHAARDNFPHFLRVFSEVFETRKRPGQCQIENGQRVPRDTKSAEECPWDKQHKKRRPREPGINGKKTPKRTRKVREPQFPP